MPHAKISRYLRHGTLPQLRVFEAAARLGSFARASEELHLAQPTVSIQIKKLAEVVGVPLFEQVGKRVHLTEAGRRLHAGCDEVFRALAALEDSIAGLRSVHAGRLRLAVSTSGTSFAPRLVAAFLGRHPGVPVEMLAFNRQTLVQRLRENLDDLYLFCEAPDLDDVVVQELLPNPLVVLARDDHPLVGVPAIPFARLAEEPFLMREEGSGVRRAAMRLFQRHGLAPRVRLELSSNESIREAILAGLGVAILARHSFGLDPESPRYRCLDVQGFPLENHWYLAYPAGKHLGATLRAFLDYCRSEARGLARDGLASH